MSNPKDTKAELTTKDAAQFKEMGLQLTTQYDRAVGGIREVLIFGAMMIHLEKVVTVSARGHGGRFGDAGTGMKAWLEEYAPKVSRPTAYRFRDLALGVRQEFKLGAKVDLQQLLTTDPKKLEPALAKKREAIFEFVEGKSQRQLLFQFGMAEPGRRGGHHPAQRKLTADERLKLEHDDALDHWNSLVHHVLLDAFPAKGVKPRWSALLSHELAQVEEGLRRAANLFRETLQARKEARS